MLFCFSRFVSVAVAITDCFVFFSPSFADHNGTFLLDCHVADPNVDFVMSWAASEVEAEKLWKLSEELVGEKFEW